MKVWAPPERARRTDAARSVIVIAAAAVAAAAVGAVAIVVQGGGAYALLALTALVTALCVGAAVRAGRTARQATLIFCLDDARRLFYVDAMLYVGYRRGLPGFIEMSRRARETVDELCAPGGRLEREMARPGSLTGTERQIIAVEKVRLGVKSDRIICRIRRPDGHEGRTALTLVHGYPDADLLEREFERLQVSELQ